VTPWQEGILSSSRVTGKPEVIGSSAGLVPGNALSVTLEIGLPVRFPRQRLERDLLQPISD